MLAWVNGLLVDESEARVSAFDHGLVVGDGVFETLKVVDGVPFALTRHLRRLARSAEGLGLICPDEPVLRAAVDELLAAHPPGSVGRLRVTVTSGPGPLGSDRGSGPGGLVLGVAPVSGWPPSSALALVPWPRNERSAVAGLKTTSYAENVVALAYAHARDAGEALFLDTRGNVCEGTGSNVFLVLDGDLVTPALSTGCLAGVTRALVLEWVGAAEVEVGSEALSRASEVFVTSSTRDVHPVHAIGDLALEPCPGPVTIEATRIFAELAATDLDP